MSEQTAAMPEGVLGKARVDGRRLRSERTRQAIIDAYLALLSENTRIPTAADISEKSGCSMRSIFERFPDLLAIRVAATDHAFALGHVQAVARNVDGDRATRLRSQVGTRGRTCERWLPLWRSLNANQGESAELKIRIGLVQEAVRQRIELMYAPELSTLPDGARRRLVIVLEALTDFESWGRMREFHGLSFDEACALWIRTIDKLLPPTPAPAGT